MYLCVCSFFQGLIKQITSYRTFESVQPKKNLLKISRAFDLKHKQKSEKMRSALPSALITLI